jgi:GTPase
MDNQPDHTHKAGYVAVMGRPNVGKSTLINALMGQKIAAVSPRPQTTRRTQLGILTQDDAQVVFIDTPGVHKARTKLGEAMVRTARDRLDDADLILFLVEADSEPLEEDRLLAEMLAEVKNPGPVLLALNKMDLVSTDQLDDSKKAYRELMPPDVEVLEIPISALMGLNLDRLLEAILDRLPEGEPFYPDDQITDLYERDIAADLIREAALIHLRDEIPHGISVQISEFTERGENGAYIDALLYVERESHKPIVIGQKGEMLKKIGTTARQEIERMSGRKVFLNLKVKVRKNWRNDEKILRWFGYS